MAQETRTTTHSEADPQRQRHQRRRRHVQAAQVSDLRIPAFAAAVASSESHVHSRLVFVMIVLR